MKQRDITWCCAMVLMGLSLWAPDLVAGLVEDVEGLIPEGVKSGGTPTETFFGMTKHSIIIAASVVGAVGALAVGWAIIVTFIEARRNAEWGKLGVTSAIGVGIIVLVAIILVYAIKWAS